MRAKKSLGQNFLRDFSVVDRIINALELNGEETVIEIGPGLGSLTERLVEKAAKVIAIEFDRELIPMLGERFSQFSSFELVNEDALKVDFSQLVPKDSRPEKLKLAANLPYNISTPILQRLIDQRELFSSMVLMFQREVVERITASPGGRERGFLSVLVENAFDAEYLFDVPPQAFYPVPKVWSAVVRLQPRMSAVSDDKLFREIVSLSFSQKRKNLLNNLKSSLADISSLLESIGIDGRRRAETLTLAEWSELTTAMAGRKAGAFE